MPLFLLGKNKRVPGEALQGSDDLVSLMNYLGFIRIILKMLPQEYDVLGHYYSKYVLSRSVSPPVSSKNIHCIMALNFYSTN